MESNRLVVLLGPSSSDISSLPSMRGFNLNNVLMASLFICWKSCTHLRRLAPANPRPSWKVVCLVSVDRFVVSSEPLCGVSSKKKANRDLDCLAEASGSFASGVLAGGVAASTQLLAGRPSSAMLSA